MKVMEVRYLIGFEAEKIKISKIVEDHEKEKDRRKQTQINLLNRFNKVYQRNMGKKVCILITLLDLKVSINTQIMSITFEE